MTEHWSTLPRACGVSLAGDSQGPFERSALQCAAGRACWSTPGQDDLTGGPFKCELVWDSEIGSFAQGVALRGKMDSKTELGAVTVQVVMGLSLTRPLATASSASSALTPRVCFCSRGQVWQQFPGPTEQCLLHVLHAQVCVSSSLRSRFCTRTPENTKGMAGFALACSPICVANLVITGCSAEEIVGTTLLLLLSMAECCCTALSLPSAYPTFSPLFPCTLRGNSAASCQSHKHSSVPEPR